MMMTDGDVTARDSAGDLLASLEGNPAAHVDIAQLLRAQEAVPCRSRLARLFGMSPLSHETHTMYRGVIGEIEVGEALDRLGAEWAVLHSVPVGSELANLDHLVIGPPGVFIVSTKNHSGVNVWASQRTFMAAGIRYPHIRNMEYEMGRAERALSAAAGSPVEVAGILAIVAPKSLVVRERHRDVAVVTAAHLLQWLTKHKRALSAAEVSHIGTAAALASTWYQSGEKSPEPVRERFEQLRREVRRAWHTQLTLAVVLSILAVGTFGALTYSILLNALGSS